MGEGWRLSASTVRLAWWRPEALPPRSRRGTTRTSRRPRPPASASSCACAASAGVCVCCRVGSTRPHTASSLARSSAPQIQTAATLRVLYQSLCPCVCRRKSNSSTSSSNSPLCTRPLAHTHSTQHTAAGPLSYSRRSRRIAVEHECDASEHERECATRNAHSVRSRNPAAARRMQPAASACGVATGAPCHPGLAPDVGHAAVVVLHGRFYRAGVVSGIGSVASSGIGVAATVIGCPECGGGSPSECAQRVLQGRETDRCDG